MILIVAVILAHLFFHLFGLRFDPGPLEPQGSWQLLSPHLLADGSVSEFLKNLYDLHAQPPLFNLWVGIGQRLGGFWFFAFTQLLMTGLGCWFFSDLLKRLIPELSARPRIADLISFVFGISPPVLLYSHWFFYSQAEWFLVLLTTWLALQRKPIALIISVTTLVFLRSAFAPFYLVILLTLMVARVGEFRTRRVLVATGIAILLVTSLCLKNHVLVQNTNTSSWLGMNWSRWIREAYSPEDWPKSVQLGGFKTLEVYESAYPEIHELPASDHPALSDGFNDVRYARVSQIFTREITTLLITDLIHSPFSFAKHWLHGWWRAGHLFFSSTVDVELLKINRERIRPWHLFWKHSFFPFGLRAFSVISFLLVLSLSYRKRHEEPIFSIWTGFTLIFLFFVFITFEYGENNRFRYPLTPLTWLATLHLISERISIFKSRSSRLG